ncbi:class I SAM-dependent methyltransferase [Bosea sp. (in: a-proteobacteria)]
MSNGGSNKIEAINQYYDTPDAVDALSKWYVQAKERAFVDFILTKTPIAATGRFVEIGGGAGLQGLLLRERLGSRYFHSDYSPSLVEKARRLGLKSEIIDGLATPFDNESVAGLLLISPSTIIGPADLRERQFRECYRVLKTGAGVAFVTSRLAHTRDRHCLDAKDDELLRSIGFEIAGVHHWGIVPGKLWRMLPVAPLWRAVEGAATPFGFGVRKIVVARRSA